MTRTYTLTVTADDTEDGRAPTPSTDLVVDKLTRAGLRLFRHEAVTSVQVQVDANGERTTALDITRS
jgi:hypothetical protein